MLMLSMITRFYDLTGGVLTLEKEDIRNLNLPQLRSHIGIVSQVYYLFILYLKKNELIPLIVQSLWSFVSSVYPF